MAREPNNGRGAGACEKPKGILGFRERGQAPQERRGDGFGSPEGARGHVESKMVASNTHLECLNGNRFQTERECARKTPTP